MLHYDMVNGLIMNNSRVNEIPFSASNKLSYLFKVALLELTGLTSMFRTNRSYFNV